MVEWSWSSFFFLLHALLKIVNIYLNNIEKMSNNTNSFLSENDL